MNQKENGNLIAFKKISATSSNLFLPRSKNVPGVYKTTILTMYSMQCCPYLHHPLGKAGQRKSFYNPVSGGEGGGFSRMKDTWMLVASLRGVNSEVWSHLGRSGQNDKYFFPTKFHLGLHVNKSQ